MKNFFKKLWKTFVDWNEFITIPLGFILWYFSPALLRFLDPTSAVYDAGIFQVILFTTIQFLIYHGVIWVLIKVTWPSLYNSLNRIFEGDEKSITDWERIKMVLWIFSLYLMSFILLSRVIS